MFICFARPCLIESFRSCSLVVEHRAYEDTHNFTKVVSSTLIGSIFATLILFLPCSRCVCNLATSSSEQVMHCGHHVTGSELSERTFGVLHLFSSLSMPFQPRL